MGKRAALVGLLLALSSARADDQPTVIPLTYARPYEIADAFGQPMAVIARGHLVVGEKPPTRQPMASPLPDGVRSMVGVEQLSAMLVEASANGLAKLRAAIAELDRPKLARVRVALLKLPPDAKPVWCLDQDCKCWACSVVEAPRREAWLNTASEELASEVVLTDRSPQELVLSRLVRLGDRDVLTRTVIKASARIYQSSMALEMGLDLAGTQLLDVATATEVAKMPALFPAGCGLAVRLRPGDALLVRPMAVRPADRADVDPRLGLLPMIGPYLVAEHLYDQPEALVITLLSTGTDLQIAPM